MVRVRCVLNYILNDFWNHCSGKHESDLDERALMIAMGLTFICGLEELLAVILCLVYHTDFIFITLILMIEVLVIWIIVVLILLSLEFINYMQVVIKKCKY